MFKRKGIKNISKGIITMIIIGMISGCNFLDSNTDPNNPVDVPESGLLAGILANFSFEVLGGDPSYIGNGWVQHSAFNLSANNPGNFDNYSLNENDINNFWAFFSYVDVMQNCKVLVEKATAKNALDYAAIAKIIWAWNMSIITDLFNNAPFSEAWQGADIPFPKYDTQEEIYVSILSLLEEAIRDLDSGTRNVQVNIADGGDHVYEGGDEEWRKLARTLQARLFMHLVYAPGYNSMAIADSVLLKLEEGFTSASDNANYMYFDSPGAKNPWSNNMNFIRVSYQYANLLLDKGDPRLFAQARLNDEGFYEGHLNGSPPVFRESVSAIGSFYNAADAALEWMTYEEALFLKAEAHLIKGEAGAAQTAYDEAIRASITKLRSKMVDGAPLFIPEDVPDEQTKSDSVGKLIEQYLIDEGTLSINPTEAYEQIMTQKYIALFLQFEAYNDWRRTRIPLLSPAENPSIGGLTHPVLRFPYPVSEILYNSENLNMQEVTTGSGALTTPVWWNSQIENCTLCP